MPLTPDVLEFYNNLGKWFLHFSEPELLGKAILPKANRNLGDRKAAVIFRRGVRVREFESSDTESLFDYNLDNLTIDESRKASDWDVKHHSAKALSDADSKTLAILFEKLLSTERSYWEFGFDIFSLQPAYFDSTEAIAGEDSVLATKATANQLERKGYNVVLAPENLISAAGLYGVKTASSVLSSDELSGREITKATVDAQAAVDYIWDLIEEVGLTNGKEKPEVRSFSSILDAGVMLNGYYRAGIVYINRDLAVGDASLLAGSKALSDRLLKVALEEIAHYATNGATDNSRDFQDYALEFAIRLARRGEFHSSNHGQRESAITVTCQKTISKPTKMHWLMGVAS